MADATVRIEKDDHRSEIDWLCDKVITNQPTNQRIKC